MHVHKAKGVNELMKTTLKGKYLLFANFKFGNCNDIEIWYMFNFEQYGHLTYVIVLTMKYSIGQLVTHAAALHMANNAHKRSTVVTYLRNRI